MREKEVCRIIFGRLETSAYIAIAIRKLKVCHEVHCIAAGDAIMKAVETVSVLRAETSEISLIHANGGPLLEFTLGQPQLGKDIIFGRLLK
jgi:DNA-binding protein